MSSARGGFQEQKPTTRSLSEESLSAYLCKIKKDGIIDDVTFHKILPSGSSPGVLYGLPKVHKAGCPFRPIVSSVNTYNYNLASYLVGILQPISTNHHTVKESFSFADWVKTYKHNRVPKGRSLEPWSPEIFAVEPGARPLY